MLSDREKDRYSRHTKLEGFGLEAQERLKSAKVLVIGAGGLGCPAVLYLAAVGVGCIGIVDGDQVSLSNLQRQVLFDESLIGKNKAEAAVAKLKSVNADIELIAYPTFLNLENALKLIQSFDLVIDGSDNFSSRYLINDACVMLGKPLVYGAIHKFTGQVSVFNFQNGPTYRCLFPEPPLEGEMPACGEVGVLGVLPGVIGTWQATEAIKVITGVGEVLSGKMLCFDLLTNQIDSFEFDLVPENKAITTLSAIEYSCKTETPSISWTDFLKLQEQGVRLIDVREESEYLSMNIGGENIPLSIIETTPISFSDDQLVVIHCQSGKRAKIAADKWPQLKQRFILEDIPWDTI